MLEVNGGAAVSVLAEQPPYVWDAVQRHPHAHLGCSNDHIRQCF